MKRLRSILLLALLVLLLTMLPTGVHAANPVQGSWGDITYEYDGEGFLYIYGTGAMPGWDGPVYTPWQEYAHEVQTVYVEDGITTLCAGAFFDFDALVTVRLPDSLETIGNNAFFSCGALTWVLNGQLSQAIPDGVKRIEAGAFCGCGSLASLGLGNSVEFVGECAFLGCTELTEITLSPALTCIDRCAFDGCFKLTAVTIPAAVTTMGERAFYDCYRLRDIRFQGNAPAFGQNVFASYWGTITAKAYYPAGNATWTAAKRQNYGGQLTWQAVDANCVAIGTCGDSISWKLDKAGVLTLSGTGAMYDYDTINYPPWHGLWYQIKSVVVEEGITEVGSCAFYKCYNVSEISLPQSLVRLGRSSIFDCDGLTHLQLGPQVSDVGESNFTNCDMLKAYTVDPANPYFCTDSNGALYNKEKTLLISVPGAFCGHFTIPYGVVEIYDSAFDCYQGLTGVTIPNSVEIIGNSAFSSCFHMESVVIPASVRRIEHAAFWCCEGLREIRFLGNAPVFEEDSVFVNVRAWVTYPAGDATWTADKFVHPESDLTWQAVAVEAPAFAVAGVGEFVSLTDAAAACAPTGGYVRLLRDVEVDAVLSKDLYLDLCGYSICGIIDTQGHAVYGMDTTTDGYQCDSMGYFQCLNEYARPLVPVTAFRTTVTGAVRRYMAVATEDGYTFHRFWLGITHTNLKPVKNAFGYRAQFYGDALVRSQVESVGYRIWLESGQSLSRYMNGFREELTLRLTGVNVTRYGEIPVNACVFLTLSDGTVVESGTVSHTMRSMLENASRNWRLFSQAQQFALQDLAERFPVIKTWDTQMLWQGATNDKC